MRKALVALLCGLAAAAGASNVAQAAVYTITPSQDATLAASLPTTNYGTDTQLFVKGSSSDNFLSVVQFTLPAIPFDEQVTSVAFSFTSIDPGGSPGTYAFTVHRVTDTWTESTVNWNNTSADYVATALASVSGAAPGATVSFDVTSLYNQWAAGTVANNGLMMNSSVNAKIGIHSRESASTSLRPTLTVTTRLMPVPVAGWDALVFSDPMNGTVAPKRIPGAILRQRGTATNTGRGTAEGLALTLPVPARTRLFVGDLSGTGTGPVLFSQGTTWSGTSFTYSGLASSTDSVLFSADNGVSYTYTPVPNVDGYDSAVTHARILPSGTFAGAVGASQPSFIAEMRVQTF